MIKKSHVVPYGKRWAVTSFNNKSGRPTTAVYHTKREAIDAGRAIAQSEGSELVVHGTAGQVFSSPPPIMLEESAIRTAMRGLGAVLLTDSILKATSPSNKPTAGKAARKAAAKKSGARKPAAKKSGGKSAEGRKAAGRKAGAGKKASKKAGSKKSARR